MPPDADRRPVAPVRDLLAGLAWGAAWWAAAVLATGSFYGFAGGVIDYSLGRTAWRSAIKAASFAAGPLTWAAPAAWATFRRPRHCRRATTWAVRWTEAWVIFGGTVAGVAWRVGVRAEGCGEIAAAFAPPAFGGLAAAGLAAWGRRRWD